MKTIVIGGTHEEAERIMRFYALSERDVKIGYDGSIPSNQFLSRYLWMSAREAASTGLLGRRADRIIISTSYLRWHLPLGGLTHLWWSVRMIESWGAKVEFS